MLRIAAMTLALALAAGPAPADSRDQLLSAVGRDLPFYIKGVDATTLTTAQLAAIKGVMNRSNLSHGDKIAWIRSILGGQHSLRGLLFN